MKSMGVITFAILALTSLTGIICNPVETEIEPNCDEYPAMPDMGLICTRIYKPVCGTNGRTYASECELCSSRMKLKMAINIQYRASCIAEAVQDECEGMRAFCTHDYRPICGSDDVTYSNKCEFCNAKKSKADLLLASEGECKTKDECAEFGNFCTLIYQPVCGSDGITYPSKCNLCGAKKKNADLKMFAEGKCQE
ncbi:double-headed protease inhibitor, submandibular gland-like [Anomaloglossus baeobatrachus]|uniref:double-headed protease inhibitor, submandibular gland-like n=1 Tax=Anomaloglossus baeobatrachus TaxID=238106 RepID=UPI003F502274